MLSVGQDAPADEIKKALRREIARYHPDKVQHLGKEFQEMAAGIAADLTEAYRILMDPALRAGYDEQLATRGADTPVPPSAGAAPTPAPPRPPSPDPSPSEREPTFSAGPAPAPPRPTAGLEFVQRAAISKLRGAIEDQLTSAVPVMAPGFDIALVTNPKRGLFKKAEESL